MPLRRLLGDKSVVTEFPASTGSEDAHLLIGPNAGVPFAYLIVGVADPAVFEAARKEAKTTPYSAQDPNFVVNLKATPVGPEARISADPAVRDRRAREILARMTDSFFTLDRDWRLAYVNASAERLLDAHPANCSTRCCGKSIRRRSAPTSSTPVVASSPYN